MTDTRVRPLAVVVALLLVLGVIGVLTVDEEGGGTVLTTAAAATTAEGSARMAMEMTFEVDGRRTTFTGEGVVEFARDRAQLTMRSPVLPAAVEILAEGTTVYVKANIPGLAAQAGGKQWLSYDTSAFASPFGGGALGGGTDPLVMLRLLEDKGIATDVRQDGEEQVRGAPTTRYTADLHVGKMMEAMDEGDAAEASKELTAAPEKGVGKITVWIGVDDVVRRSSSAVTVPVSGRMVSIAVTVELFDFGAPVDIAFPPADQVQTVDEVPGT